MNWTDERVEQLRKLWTEGLSASQIALQLGGVSRNAVIGKVHRLKLTGRGRATGVTTRTKKAPKAAPIRPATSRPAPSGRPVTVGATALRIDAAPEFEVVHALAPLTEIPAPVLKKLKLVELSERTCKWPVGDPLSEDFHFCGNESGESGPYCRYHARIAYQPTSERKRLR